MPKKARITLIIVIAVLIIALISGVLAYLYIETDIFKTNEEAFVKYFTQNFTKVGTIMDFESAEIDQALQNNKYTTSIIANIEYTEEIGTSNENTNNPVNDLGLKIEGQTDKINDYSYKDIKFVKNGENIARFEYLNQEDVLGVRLDGIQQFVTIENSESNNIYEDIGIPNLNSLLKNSNIKTMFEFTETEKIQLRDRYMSVLQSNISKDKYIKQTNSLITINNKDVNTTAYSIKLTTEQYNNLYIKLLEEVAQDEILLGKIDQLESNTEEINGNFRNLRSNFIDQINQKIEEIENNNIGSEEATITVYVSNKDIVRTAFETSTQKTNIDFYNNGTAIKIDYILLGETENEQILQIEKNIDSSNRNIYVEYEKITDNDIEEEVKLTIEQSMQNNSIVKTSSIEIKNEKNDTILSIENNINIVDSFTDDINFEGNNVSLNELDEENTDLIVNVLIQNVSEQIQRINEEIELKNYITMLQNLNILDKDNTIQISNESTVTETEKSRFNSNYEFFNSENLSVDNIRELLQIAKNNWGGVVVTFEDGGQEVSLDNNKISSNNYTEAREYIESVKQIDIIIDSSSNGNTVISDSVSSELETFEAYLNANNSNSNKYNVTLSYDELGLINDIKIEVQKNN